MLALSARILQDQLQTFINFKTEVHVEDTSAIEEAGFSAALLKKSTTGIVSAPANCLKNDNTDILAI